jgi:hypothetical protein
VWRPVLQQQLHPLERAGSVREYAGGITQRLVEVAQDPQRGFLPAPPGDLASHRMLEPRGAQTSGAVEVPAVAVQDHRHCRDPGLGPERLPGGVQSGRPDALEQVTDLLDLAARVDDQFLTAGTQVPQPTPGLVDGLGDVAAQPCGQPGDQDRVLVVGLVEGQVLTAPGPGGPHRLHAHERHRPVPGELTQDSPPVPGRLARHRHAREALRVRALHGPIQRDPEIPRPAPERPTCQHTRVVVGDHHHLFLVGQIDPDDRVLEPNQLA